MEDSKGGEEGEEKEKKESNVTTLDSLQVEIDFFITVIEYNCQFSV